MAKFNVVDMNGQHVSEIELSLSLIHILREPESVLLSVVSNRQLPRLEKLAHTIDPTCFMTVSYTHLDVYKRQSRIWVCPRS